ncbi:hypothetical protein SteCoe_5989 [Stentor coeruleus]|uniref:Cyclic nucleotide-binding domain-containing protein n=1 Tax=Stentor coeruleus TaxID=5963 RepID=A0A1R2CR76_9CILI|nr:hypothetical protein SteCoe_5989 [Stentor coeruleus]
MSTASSESLLAIILFVAFSLLLMIVCYEMKKHLHIPVAPSLLIFGLLIRIIGPHIGQMGEVVTQVKLIDHELISLVFFPILIFEASFSGDWYTIKKEIWQIIPLATTVVIGCTILNGVALRFIFGYEYDWDQLYVLGVILSATDHIAVDSLLKDIYAPDKLETLISGETMFNEATVLVLFKILVSNTSGLAGFADSLKEFSRLAFGGFGMGIGSAIVMGLVIRRILNDFYIETNLALILAYLLFWVCDMTVIHVSGALALVSYGLFMSAYGKTLISPSIEERLHEFIEIWSRNIESIVFIIAGLLFADIAIYRSNELVDKDYYVLFLMFPLSYIIRGIVLLCHYPALRYLGYGMTWKDLVFMTFAGMKGVISTALVLMAYHNEEIEETFRPIIGYLGIGTAWLSIIAGGVVSRIIVRTLGLEDLTDVQENMLAGVTKALVEISEAKIEELHSEKDLKLISWDRVLELAGPYPLVRSILKKSKVGQQVLRENPEDFESHHLLKRFSEKFSLSKNSLATEMRRRYLTTLKGIYWHQFEEGLCHGEASLILIDSCNISLDKESEPMHDWVVVRKLVYKDSAMQFWSKLSRLYVIGKIFRRFIYKRIILAYDSANNFIKCHEETEKLIDEMEIDIDKNVFEEVMREAHEQVKLCEEFMNIYIIDCYPEVLAEVQTKRCCKLLLYSQRELISEVYENGLIKELEYESLIKAIDASIRTVTFQGIPPMPILRDVLFNRFTGATLQEINLLLSKITEKVYKPCEILYLEGYPANGAFLIIRGRVLEKSTWISQELIIGNIVGVQHLLEEFAEKYTSTATAITSTVVAHIPKEILEFEGFVEDMYTEAAEELILLNRERYNLKDAQEKHILRVMGASIVKVFEKGKRCFFPDGGFLMKGKGYNELKNWVVKPSNKPREMLERSIILMFPKDFRYSWEKNVTMSEVFKRFCVKITNDTIARKDVKVEDLSMINESKLDDTMMLMVNENPQAFSIKFKSVVPQY